MLPTSDIKAVEMVASIKPMVLLDDLRQDASRAISQIKKGQVYPAKLLEITDKGDAKVLIEGHQLKLNLQAHLTVGDTLMLKYLGDNPSPSFKLLSQEPPSSSPEVRISQTAKEIVEQVSQAEQKGTSRVYQAAIPATTTPNNVNQFAADLQHSLSSTGLFYESHLADFAQGSRSLASLMQEPQNQGTVAPHQLIAQQLNVLETQRVLWHGEIWPGQLAYWQVEADAQQQSDIQEPTEAIVSSDLSLELPNLGNVTARIRLVGDKLNIAILAEDSATVGTMQTQAAQLVESLQQHVARLEGISIQRGAKPDA
jgi:hypothetical protein